ncbi:MAG: hypothetical protein MJ007_03790 [Paludibacteraceae bacterium]|nr:hypothetical protein [Paludibacteraceae bacterium]
MQRKFNNGIAIGIIDNDKHCPSYLNEMDLLCKSEHLAVYKHRYMCHYIITIIPAVDTFILECAKEAGVNVRDFGFSSNLKEFTKCTKKVTSNINPIFTRLFSILEDSSEFGLLKQVLTYLIENKYQSTNDSLKQFFDVR